MQYYKLKELPAYVTIHLALVKGFSSSHMQGGSTYRSSFTWSIYKDRGQLMATKNARSDCNKANTHNVMGQK